MISAFPSAQDLAVLNDARSWRFISSAFPAEVEPVSQPRHESWARKNTHTHPHREFFIVLDGEGYYQYCGRPYPVSPGTILLLDTSEPHQAWYPPDQPPGRHLWCHLYIASYSVALYSVGDAHSAGHCRELWRQPVNYLQLGFPGEDALFPKVGPEIPAEWARRLSVASLEYFIISMLINTHRIPTDSRKDSRDRNFQDRIVTSMMRYIENNRGRNCSMETLAHIAGYSKNYFSRLFKEHAGVSVQECVDAARIRALQHMLAKRFPLKTIARHLGFSHESTLCRWRRQHKV